MLVLEPIQIPHQLFKRLFLPQLQSLHHPPPNAPWLLPGLGGGCHRAAHKTLFKGSHSGQIDLLQISGLETDLDK